MVAIVTAQGLGVERSSASVLGARGQLGSGSLGQTGEQVYVNAATGNLVVRNIDEVLLGRGPDIMLGRAYNSLGAMTDDNGDNWQTSMARVVGGLTGTANTSGSTVKRTDWDGTVTTYAYNAGTGKYIASEAGERDTLSFASNVWTWTDGKSRSTETYDAANGGRVTGSFDADGNALAYTYTSGKLTRVTSANGEYTQLTWSANNLTQVQTFYKATSLDPVAAGQLFRAYDAVLARAPDGGGLAGWLTNMNSGSTLSAIYGAMYGSTEFQNATGASAMTNSAFVDFAHQRILRRVPTTEEAADGLAELVAGTTRANFMLALGESVEHIEICEATTGRSPSNASTWLTNPKSLTRVRYGYDASNRLTTVTVDLTPDNNAVTDGVTYVTTYTYDGTSKRVASIAQTDGTLLQIGYTQSGGIYRVTSLTQTAATGDTRTTSFSYLANNDTVVTDANGKQTTLDADATGRLLGFSTPPADDGGASQLDQYGYDTLGNAEQLTDPLGHALVRDYDDAGNLVYQRDAAGNTVTRTYGAKNELLTETRYLTPDPDGGGAATASDPVTTRFAYDGENHLRFLIDATGRVTEYLYNAVGQQTAMIEYVDQAYSGTPFVESDLATWASGIANRATVQRTDTTYDWRGNVTTVTRYSSAWSAGGARSFSTYSRTFYFYNQHGQLIKRATNASPYVESYAYDGLSRITSATDLAKGVTTTVYADATQTTTVTLSNGTTETSVYNRAGELLSTTAAATSIATAQSTFKYDKLGRLRETTDPTGIKSWKLYDRIGRLTADIAGDGALTEYRYDAADRIVAAIRYANRLSAGQLASLNDGSGNPADILVAAVRPPAHADDSWSWTIYDAADRVVQTIDGAGGVTAMSYDGASRIVATIEYVTALSAGTLTSLRTTLPTAPVTPTTSGADRITRRFYDAEDREIARLDGVGGLTELSYDGAGRLVTEIGRATPVAAGLRASGTLAQLVASAGTSAADTRIDHVYDGRGLERFSVDVYGRPTEYVYDGADRVIRTVDYAGTIAAPSATPPAPAPLYSLAHVQSQIVSTGLISNTNNRVTRTIYDNSGRIGWQLDALNKGTAYTYDNRNNLTKTVAISASYSVSGDPTVNQMVAWVAAWATDASNRTTRMVYDGADRLVYTVDPLGYIAEQQYDTAGRVTAVVRHPAVYTVADGATRASVAAQIGTISSDAVTTTTSYDGIGRVLETVDGVGIVTRYSYDALDRVVDVTEAYGTADASTTRSIYDAVDRIVYEIAALGTSEQAVTTYAYDGAGNLLGLTDARGFTTVRAFDAMGRVLAQAIPLDGTNYATTSYEYDAFGNVAKTTDPRGNASYAYYDKLGRLTLAIDAEGYATASSYGIGDMVTSVRRYAARAAGTGSTTTLPTLSPNAAADAITGFSYDKLDRLLSTTDAEGFTESYVLNRFGERTSVTNKLGGVTTNIYDKRGFLIQETLPAASIRSDGTQQAATTINKYEYDYRGNRTKMIEAFGLTEQRTTIYAYDKRDRLTHETGDPVIATAQDLQTSIAVLPQKQWHYDLRDNVVRTIDAGGGQTFHYYDDLNRKTAEISPVGTLSAWTHDANGNVLTARVYGDVVALPATPGGTSPAPVNAATYRETLYGYDRANRLTDTIVTDVLVGQDVGGTYQTGYQALTTHNDYDAMGNVVRQVDARGGQTFLYYDKLGRRIGQVDREAYVTSWSVDGEGNVVEERRHNLRPAMTVSTTADFAALAASTGHDGADRYTLFTHDQNGRRLTETRLNVQIYSIAANGSPTAQVVNATISYAYNGLGQVTLKTEANGDGIGYAYDSMGRQIGIGRTMGSAYNIVQMSYNGLGDLTRTSENAYVGLAADARVTTFTYGAGGRLTATADPTGFTHYYYYDAVGRMVADTWYRQTSTDGGIAEGRNTRHDLAGRVVHEGDVTSNGSVFVPNDYRTTSYNAYGDIVSRGLNGVVQEELAYDARGLAFRSNAGGVIRFFFYDAGGNLTLEANPHGFQSLASTQTQADALSQLTNGGAHAVGGAYDDSYQFLVPTITLYDNRNQAILVREPFRELGEADGGGQEVASLTSYRFYNAFGEVFREYDPRSAQTDYHYNTMGRLLFTERPWVSVTYEDGSSALVRPGEGMAYDASGRLVAIADANGNLTTRLLLAGSGHDGAEALVTKEFHPDGGNVTTAYNVFGDATSVTDEIGRITTMSYDKASRLLSVAHSARAAWGVGNPSASAVQLIDYYAYDGLGQRIKHWNNVYGAGVVERTDYDVAGRVTSAVDMSGLATTHSYGWSAGAGAVGIGVTGGWVQVTVDGGGRTATETVDGYGRMLGASDFGSRVYQHGYDYAGRVASRYRTDGAAPSGTITYYTWSNGGLLTQVSQGILISDQPNQARMARYRYDAAGNRVREREEIDRQAYDPYAGWVTTTESVRDAAATYDGMGRLLQFDDAGVRGLNDTQVNHEYDAAGNLRRVGAFSQLVNGVTGQYGYQENWYLYDSMNRVVRKGELSGPRPGTGLSVIRGYAGVDLAYNAAGERVSATRTQQEVDPYSYAVYDIDVREDYRYTADGYLADTYVASGSYESPAAPATGTLKATDLRDALGRVTDHTEYYADGVTWSYRRQAAYNTRNEVTLDDVWKRDGSANGWTGYITTYDYQAEGATPGVYDGAWQGGQVTRSITQSGGVEQSRTVRAYEWWDTAREDFGYSDIPGVASPNTNHHYDAWGNLVSIIRNQSYEGGPGTSGTQMYFSTDVDGRVVERGAYGVGAGAASGTASQLHFRIAGREIGTTGNDGADEGQTYDALIAERDQIPGIPYRRGGPAAAMQFDPFYTAIGPSSPTAAAATYTVQAGDTLPSIAATLWGDANLWYLIADANGLTDMTPAVGTNLTIPTKAIRSGNTAATTRPYSHDQAIGDTSPTAAPPSAKSGKKGCGGLGQVLLAVVAIAVTVASQGTLAAALGSKVLGGIAAGALGSVASQGVGLATGLQDKFSFKGVALAGIAGGVAGGIGKFAPTTSAVTNGAIRGVVVNAATQGIAVASGLQKRFDFAGVAAAGVLGGVTGGLSAKLGDGFAARLATSTAGAIAGAAARSLITGTGFGDNVMAVLPDAIGATIGNAIGERIGGALSRSSANAGGGSSRQSASSGTLAAGSAPTTGNSADTAARSVQAAGTDAAGANGKAIRDYLTAYADAAQDKRVAKQLESLGRTPDVAGSVETFAYVNGALAGTTGAGILSATPKYIFEGGVLGNYQTSDGKNAVFMPLASAELAANLATADLIRSVAPPVDLALSVRSITQGSGSIGDYLTVGTAALPGAAQVRTAETAIARAVRLGREGEKAAGIVGSKSGILINGRMRFPDEVTQTTVREVKNVARQGWTQQLKDYADLAKRDGKTFEIVVRGPLHPSGGTSLSKPLDAAVRSGIVSLKFIAGTY